MRLISYKEHCKLQFICLVQNKPALESYNVIFCYVLNYIHLNWMFGNNNDNFDSKNLEIDLLVLSQAVHLWMILQFLNEGKNC